jgi:RHS repeat-associated protein
MAGISSNALKGVNYSKNRKEYNGIEHTTDLDLNQYDAFYRNFDPQIGRWWQVDPKPTHWESLYASMGNNPIKNSDFLGDTLIVSGTQAAMTQYSQITNSGTGGFYKTNIAKDGNVTLSSTGKKGEMTAEQKAFYKEISGVIEKGKVNVEVVQNDKSVIGGSYASGKIDVSDISAFKEGPVMSGPSTLAHEVVEQADKQLNGTSYVDAHKKALGTEETITGYKRDNGSQINNVKADPGGGVTGTVKVNYSKGTEVKTVTIHLQNSNITKVDQ